MKVSCSIRGLCISTSVSCISLACQLLIIASCVVQVCAVIIVISFTCVISDACIVLCRYVKQPSDALRDEFDVLFQTHVLYCAGM